MGTLLKIFHLMLKLPLLQKIKHYKYYISESEHFNIQSTIFGRMFDLIKQSEVIIEPCQVNMADLPDFEILKKVVRGCHAAFFSCTSVQLSLKTMQHPSCDFQSLLPY